MTFPENPLERRALAVAVVVSLAIHGLLLFVNNHKPKQGSPLPRIEASLARQPAPVKTPEPKPSEPPKKQAKKPDKQQARPRVIAMPKSLRSTPQNAPKFTVAEKAEMNDFLNELARETKTKPAPTLAQRSLAMAQQVAREQPRDGDGIGEVVERLPNSPPIDPFGLEMYMDGLVKKLNRSAAFVRNDPRTKGLRVASVLVRLNPDGSLNNFRILNAADQQDEVDFIRRVVEQAVPFSAFPGDIRRSAKTLSLLICIQPPRAGSGFGFTRHAEGRGC